LYTTPIVGIFPIVRPMETQTKGNLHIVEFQSSNMDILVYHKSTVSLNIRVDYYPCTKLVVPSRGSTIHVGSSVSSEVP